MLKRYANLKKTDIEPLVVEVIKQLIRDKEFAIGIKKRIGMNVDVSRIIKEIDNYELKLKEVKTNKTRLEEEVDSLPLDVKYRERKICDMTARIDSMYDIITELEEKIEDAQYKRRAIEEKSLTLENIYRILEHFSEFYDIMNDEERKELLLELIKEVHIYPEGESEYPLKSIKFNFPIFQNGKEVDEIFLNKQPNVETLVVLSHKKPDGHISVNVEFGEEEGQVSLKNIEKRALERAPKKKATYKDIQAYIEEKYGFKVHTSYIAEVKRDLGLPMYDAPNAVEELKRPRSHPTAEMEEAIKDAVKHFNII